MLFRDGSAQQRQSDFHDFEFARWLDCGQNDLQRKLKYQAGVQPRSEQRVAKAEVRCK